MICLPGFLLKEQSIFQVLRRTVVGGTALLPREIRLQVKPKGRIAFPSVQSPLRTDYSFRERFDPDHHVDLTDLEELPIDMVFDFPFEPMHLVS